MGELSGLRVGVVGTGWMAETHTEALRRLGIEVAGVAGRTPERAREVADRLGLATAYDSVEALVAEGVQPRPCIEVMRIEADGLP